MNAYQEMVENIYNFLKEYQLKVTYYIEDDFTNDKTKIKIEAHIPHLLLENFLNIIKRREVSATINRKDAIITISDLVRDDTIFIELMNRFDVEKIIKNRNYTFKTDQKRAEELMRKYPENKKRKRR